jgi:hypothetical protein
MIYYKADFHRLLELLNMRPRTNPTVGDIEVAIKAAVVEIETARGILNDVLSNQDFNSLIDVLGLPPYHKPAPTDFSRVINIARCEIEGLRELVQRQSVPDAPREWDGVEELFVGAFVRNGEVVAIDDSGAVVCIRRSDGGYGGTLETYHTRDLKPVKDHFEMALEKVVNPDNVYFKKYLGVLRELSQGGYINILSPAVPAPAAPIGEHFNCRPEVKLFSKDEMVGFKPTGKPAPSSTETPTTDRFGL